MGSFVFRWPYPATGEVHVTGSFDDWGKTEKLEPVEGGYEKEVHLPSADKKITYKFVVNDQWVVDDNAPKEDDGHYNVNNVLLPENIKVDSQAVNAPADRPVTRSLDEAHTDVPGAFPETPSNEAETVSVNPIPATGHDNIHSTVTTSKEDYEKGGTLAGPGAFVVAGGAAAAVGAAGIAAGSAFSKHENKENLIPESSLPMGAGAGAADTMDTGPFISSSAGANTTTADLASKAPLENNTPFVSSAAGPNTTTADLASKVPLEQKRQGMIVDPKDAPVTEVPETVKESMAEAHEAPEAAGSSDAVAEKTAMEKELASKVPISEAKGAPESAAADQTSYHGLATAVPATVEQSMATANAAPEAASSDAEVAEKSEVERQLLEKVPKAETAGEPAPTVAAATSATAPGASTDGALDGKGASEVKTATSATAPSASTDGALDGKGASEVKTATSATAPSASTDGALEGKGAREAKTAVDPALADEPAVKMMTQNEEGTTTTDTSAVAATAATDAKSSEPKIPETPKKEVSKAPETPKKETGAGAAAGTTSATSTPAKNTDTAASSPATGEKKKKNRLSRIWHKIVD